MTAPRPLRAPLAALTWCWGRVVAAGSWALDTQLDRHVCEWANLTAGEDER